MPSAIVELLEKMSKKVYNVVKCAHFNVFLNKLYRGREMKIRKYSSCLLSLLLIFSMLLGLGIPAEAANTSGKQRMINVVYDDSGSMVKDLNTDQFIERWSQAKYAMEVFCAMMSKEDTMNIYPMSIEGKLGLTVKGSDQNRVKAVHDMNGKYRNTPFVTVTSAAADLLKVDESYERWLIIITDGAFDDGATPSEKVQQTLDSYNEAGIKTVYLAIGNDAQVMTGNAAKGAFAEKAADGEVLSKVTNIANQIFTHQILNDRYIEKSGNDTKLNIDIPTDQIIVFAQGDNVSVGNLSLNGKTIKATEVQNVKYSDVIPENESYKDAVIDKTLKGVVATFEAGEEPFENGQFSISVSNATTVEYYYRPGVTVNCALLYDGVEVQSGDELYAGEYEVSLSFINPLTGKTIESDLLSDAEFTLTVLNNGEEQVITSRDGKVSLVEGDVNIDAIAGLPGHVKLSSKRSYIVLPEPIKLNLTFTPETPTYTPDRIAGNAEPIILHITNSKTGLLITDEERNAMEVVVKDANGVTWDLKKGEEAGSFELHPKSADGTLAGIEPGAVKIAVKASYQIGHQYAFGSANLGLTIGEYQGSQLQIVISDPANNYDLNDMDHPESMVVTVLYENPATGEYEPLTPQMWEEFSLKAYSEERMDWTIEKGTEPGTWLVTPGFYMGDPLMTASGTVRLIVRAEGISGEYEYLGEAVKDLEVTGLSKANLLAMLLPRLIAGVIFLWLLIGYIKKKRLRIGKLNPRCYFKDTASPKQRITKDFFRVILPYLPERATVKCHKSVYQCNFPDLRIEATGPRSFRIINATMPLNAVKINGESYPDMETLKNARFGFGNFEITSINPTTKRRLGTFRFN